MEPVSPQEKLLELQEEVALLAAPAQQQEEWAVVHRMPSEEIALQFYDAVPMWLARLRDTGMIDTDDERALTALSQALTNCQERLFLDGPKVTNASEWFTIRELAMTALESLRRPLEEKAVRRT